MSDDNQTIQRRFVAAQAEREAILGKIRSEKAILAHQIGLISRGCVFIKAKARVTPGFSPEIAEKKRELDALRAETNATETGLLELNIRLSKAIEDVRARPQPRPLRTRPPQHRRARHQASATSTPRRAGPQQQTARAVSTRAP